MQGVEPFKLLARVVYTDVTAQGDREWEMPEPHKLEEWISGYEVRSLIGRGGMGAVYKVFHKGLQRLCCLKLLPLSISRRPDFEERFLREARAMASLNHPHIACVYDSGSSVHGQLYYVMEYVDGKTLTALMGEGGLDQNTVSSIIMQVCDALEHSHDKGYVHRDIKPGNVLLDGDGQVKVVDFGIAKMFDQNDACELDHGVTLLGDVIGTPGYMSPEQSSGGEVDHRTDIYALGVMMYEMLTGSLPQGAFEPPGATPGVSSGWDVVVMTCLKQNPAHRYQSVGQLKSAIEARECHTGASKRLGWKTLVAIGLVLLVTGYLVHQQVGMHSAAQTPLPWPVLAKQHENSLGMSLVPLPGTRVLVSRDETCWADWDTFLSDTGYAWDAPLSSRVPTHSALNISWLDAKAFCQWLTEKERAEGRISKGMRYRLPTDQEWSIAAGLSQEWGATPQLRSGKVLGVYPWGNQWPPPPEVAAVLDQGMAFNMVQGLAKAYRLVAGAMAPDRIGDYKQVTSDLYHQPWKKVVADGEDFVVLPQLAGQVLELADDRVVMRYWNDKTVVFLGTWMGYHAQWAFSRVGWQSANWADAGFRDFFLKEKWGAWGRIGCGPRRFGMTMKGAGGKTAIPFLPN
ncbi:MAG: protein kinase [Akkermansiaceae bacterium]|nr:protein kinase [Akkermansiaceae bacterium]